MAKRNGPLLTFLQDGAVMPTFPDLDGIRFSPSDNPRRRVNPAKLPAELVVASIQRCLSHFNAAISNTYASGPGINLSVAPAGLKKKHPTRSLRQCSVKSLRCRPMRLPLGLQPVKQPHPASPGTT